MHFRSSNPAAMEIAGRLGSYVEEEKGCAFTLPANTQFIRNRLFFSHLETILNEVLIPNRGISGQLSENTYRCEEIFFRHLTCLNTLFSLR